MFRAPLFLLVLLVSLPAQSRLEVPSAFPTIQGAIDAATNGDTVAVAAGIYFESDIDLLGRQIVLEGATGDPRDVVIDAGLAGRVLYAISGEGRQTIVRGLTLRGGRPRAATSRVANVRDGGGIYIDGSSPVFEDCIIRGNSAAEVALSSVAPIGGHGGGVFCINRAAPSFFGCRIESNRAGAGLALQGGFTGGGGNGGGLYFQDRGWPAMRPRLEGCIIEGNEAGELAWFMPPTSDMLAPGAGGGIYASGVRLDLMNCVIAANLVHAADRTGSSGGGLDLFGAAAVIDHCTIVSNTVATGTGSGAASFGGGIRCRLSDTTVRNSIIWGNRANMGPQLSFDTQSMTGVASCVVEGGAAGQNVLDVDPLLDGTYHLLPGSPCLDAGDASLVRVPRSDFEGEPRRMGREVDIGADELLGGGLRYRLESSPTGGFRISIDGGVAGARYSAWFTQDPLNEIWPFQGWFAGLHISYTEFTTQAALAVGELAPFGGRLDANGAFTSQLPGPFVAQLSGRTLHSLALSIDETGNVLLVAPPVLGFMVP